MTTGKNPKPLIQNNAHIYPPVYHAKVENLGCNTIEIYVTYATTEGQTKKIATFIVSKIKDLGHKVTIEDAKDYFHKKNLDKYDKIIFAGSVHEARHQEELVSFVIAHKKTIKSKKSLFISVSLSSAFKETRKESQKYVQDFISDIKFKPTKILYVAGAIRHAAYGYYQEMIVTHNVLPEGTVDNMEEDHEFTDWSELESAICDFVSD